MKIKVVDPLLREKAALFQNCNRIYLERKRQRIDLIGKVRQF